MLEQSKLRLEMSLEQTRKEHRREVSSKDDEVDEVRNNAQKKVRGKYIHCCGTHNAMLN